jgi:hypothetical protein
VPTSLDADESAGIVQLPANAPQAAPGQSRGLPRGPGVEENSQGAETRARRRLENVTQEPPGSRVGIGISASDPSHVVRHGREIAARSASSCCERPVRLRAARNMPPVISPIVMLRFFARRQRTSMSAYFTNSLTPASGLGLLASLRGGFFPVGQRVARSLPERWPAVRSRGEATHYGSRPSTRARGAAWSLPPSSRE